MMVCQSLGNLAFGLVLGLIVTSVGCGKKAAQPPPQAPGGAQAAPPAPVGRVRRTIDRGKVQNDLREIALFYIQYHDEMGKSPPGLDEFAKFMQKDAGKLVQTLKEGAYEIIWNAPLGSGSILAYEKNADLDGKQMVVRGDASISSLRSDELSTALKNRP
jgi:hypothetical protein